MTSRHSRPRHSDSRHSNDSNSQIHNQFNDGHSLHSRHTEHTGQSRPISVATPASLTSTYGTCPICHELKNELGVVGGRNGCGHRICRRCIAEWMGHENSCPICRTRFHKVVFPISSNLRIHEDKSQPVAEGYLDMMNEVEEYDSEEDRKEKEDLQHDIAQCMYCRETDNEDKLLLCDARSCFKAAHTYCLNPPLRRVPRGEWFCPECEDSICYTLNPDYNIQEPPEVPGSVMSDVSEMSDGQDDDNNQDYDPPALNTRNRHQRALPDRESLWSFRSGSTSEGTSLLYSVYSD